MSHASARLSLGFSCLGHFYSHLFAPIFYVVALGLESDFALSHGQVIGLILVGNVLFGVAAPVAGWLGDRWSATGMMGLFFVGTGGSMILTGICSRPEAMAATLALTGLFAAIYHPVGIAWLVRNAERRGAALGINGVFGGLGPAVAALIAGALVETVGWRWAFLVPGALMVATGAVFYGLLARGIMVETKVDRRPEPPPSRGEMVRAFLVLSLTMVCTGLIYQATQPALPKMFSERLEGIVGSGVFGASAAVALIYLMAGAAQVMAGRIADRYPLKRVYVAAFILQAPFLLLAGSLSGGGLLATVMVMVVINVGALPTENGLVARYSPARWRGLAFGLKFILAFGLSGLGVKLEGALYDLTGGFLWLFATLSAIAAVAAAAALLLPNERREAVETAGP